MLFIVANVAAFMAGVVIVVTTIIQIVKEILKWKHGNY